MIQLCILCNAENALGLLCADCEQELINCYDISANINSFYYQIPASTLIKKFKYQQDLLAAAVLAKHASLIFSGMWQQYDAIIPMPVNSHRLRQRGLHCTDYLVRIIKQPLPIINTYNWRPVLAQPQKNYDLQARANNITSEHFNIPKLAPGRYLVFDDVITTGATWRAFKRATKANLTLITLASTNNLAIKGL